MNLTVDTGNSSVKAAVFHDGQAVAAYRGDGPSAEFFEAILQQWPGIGAAIISSTRNDNSEELLAPHIKRLVRLGSETPVPLKNLYRTPATLGYDRLAAAVGAWKTHEGRNIMMVDLGTAITIDMVTARGEYLGGNISPGAATRFRSLNEHTDRLPLLGLPETEVPGSTGRDTAEAVEWGVVGGICFELEGYRRRLEGRYEDLLTVFTGGDAEYFAKRLKYPIFVVHNLVEVGLNTILEYNEP
ncbi:MAG: type III pantothenate kinase [Rikenellaceae bacterium]|jgi:type III pantothenate kinase|nr:type III pantothenate kinase [Rikenellaceae bacterium]